MQLKGLTFSVGLLSLVGRSRVVAHGLQVAPFQKFPYLFDFLSMETWKNWAWVMISLWGKFENLHVFVKCGDKGSLCISCNFFQCIFSASLSAHRIIALSYTFHRLKICWTQPITIIFVWTELLYQATPVDYWAACRLNTYSWCHGSSVSCTVMMSSVCRAVSKPIEGP